MVWVQRFKFTALERRVFLVALVSVLPVAVLSCVLLVASARDRRENLLRASEDTMAALMSAVDAEIQSTIAALDALAASPRLARSDYAGLHEEVVELLARRPGLLNVVVADTERQYVNARVPPGEPLPEMRFAHLAEEALQSQKPVAGEVHFSPLLGQNGVAVLVPYIRPGRRLVIEALIEPDHFLGLLDPLGMQKISPEGVIGIFDANAIVVARTLNQRQSVGKPASATLVKLLAAGGDRGSAITRTIEGAPAYTVYRRSPFSRWSVAVGMPMRAVDGPVTRSYIVLGVSTLASVLLGLIAAALVGRTIVVPMRELEDSATRVGRGEPPLRPGTRLAEVQRVAAALDRAHQERAVAFQREHEARLAAEEASKAKDEFLAMLGHELRNPLAAITNATQLIERHRQSLTPQAATATGIITRQIRHLARLTDDLLDAGRVILGKISLTRAPLDLAAAVSAVVESLRSTARMGDHQVEMALQPAWVFADATRIDQIVGNLLTNALKYTPAGGRISITTRREGTHAMLTVSDTGIGLEPDLLPRAFDLFVQGERALDRSQGGLGIGLTLVRRLADLHGGTVEAHSAGTGMGATFTVRLPGIEAPAAAGAVAGAQTANVRKRVALVEDNDDARSSLKMLLESMGHTVVEASDGTAGVALMSGDSQIAVAFVDIGLPGLDGYGVARAVRGLRGRTIRLVAMSGYGAERDVVAGVEAGFDAYVVKPADLDALLAEIDRAG
jgi:signal transduction histidine kinase